MNKLVIYFFIFYFVNNILSYEFKEGIFYYKGIETESYFKSFLEGDLKTAFEFIDSRKKTDEILFFNKSVILYKLFNYKLALENFLKLESKTSNLDIKNYSRLYIANICYKLNDYNLAYKYYSLVNFSYFDFNILNRFIQLSILLGKDKTIFKIIKVVEKDKIENIDIFNSIATFYAKKYDIKNAILYLKKAYSLKKNMFSALQLANLYYKLKNYDKTIEICDDAVNSLKDKNLDRLYYIFINSLFNLGRYDYILKLVNSNKIKYLDDNTKYIKYLIYTFRGEYYNINRDVLKLDYSQIKIRKEFFELVKELYLDNHTNLELFILENR